MKKQLFLGLSALCFAALGQEQKQDTVKTIILNEVVVLGTRAAEDAPFAMETVRTKSLASSNAGQSAAALIGNLPSVVSTSDDGLGIGYTSLRIRGSDQTRINISISDVPLNDGESHNVFWVNLPDIINSTADMQIVRGAGSSVSGTGGFGGAINFRPELLSDSMGGGIALFGGSYGTQRYSANFNSGKTGSGFFIQGSVSKVLSSGYAERASSDLFSYFVSAAYAENSTILRFMAFGGREKTYQAWNGATKEQLEQNRRFNSCGAIYDGSWENIVGYYDNETDNYAQDHFQLHFWQGLGKFKLRAAAHLTLGGGYYENYKQGSILSRYMLASTDFTETDLIARKHLDNYFYGGLVGLDYKGRSMELNFGASATAYSNKHFGRVVWVKDNIGFNPETNFYYNVGNKQDANIFIKAAYSANDNIKLFGELQYRHVDYRVDGTEDKTGTFKLDKIYNFLSPKFGVSYKFLKNNELYFSYSQAHKEPSRTDLKDGNGMAVAEHLNDFELGYKYTYMNILSLNANLYAMLYDGQLVPTGEISDTGAPLRKNVKNSRRLGMELTGACKPAEWFKWGLNATLSENTITDYPNVEQSCDIAYSPAFIGANSFEFIPFKDFSAELVSKYVSGQYMSNENEETSKLKGFFISDINFAYGLNIKKARLDFSASIKNVFNTPYISNGVFAEGVAYYFAQAQITAFAGLRVGF